MTLESRMPTVVSLDALRRRLEAELGAASPLFRRFDRALARHDESLVAGAITELARAPREVRDRVRAALIAWLFEPQVPVGRAAHGAPSPTVH
jgi:hypothetical protein